MNRVVITGIGFATSIGVGEAEVLSSLREMRHGFSYRHLAGEGNGPGIVCGSVDGFDVEEDDSRFWKFPGVEELDPGFVRGLPPHGPYALVSMEEATKQAGLSRDDLGNPATGLFCASIGSPRNLRFHLNKMAAADWQRVDPKAVVSSIAGTLNFNLAAHYGITGANCSFVSACTSSSHALGFAFDEIALGRQEIMIVVGAQDGNADDLLPFLGMRALSSNPDPSTASRPFDRYRDGFVPTGGGAALILESESSATRRGCSPLAEMLGWGQASDGYHVAAPHPEGRGIRSAIERCLAATDVSANCIDWISAHATSTEAGDRAEALALRSLGYDNSERRTFISSTKGLTGHGLSYSGVLEAAICALSIREGIIPGNAALEDPDEACDDLRLPTRTEDHPLHLVLNNSSGFGGTNVCHLFSRP